MQHTSIRAALARVFQIPLRPSAQSIQHARSLPSTSPSLRSSFSTSASLQAKKGGKVKRDPKITAIRHFLHHPTTLTPRPLRFSRNRALRHWTIRRAWSLFYHNRRLSRQAELMRQYQSMASANEELRTGVGDGGKLFRRGMMKVGVWSIPERGGGVPIEYARPLTEWVGTVGGLG
ncbi:uncharacterized protein AB675_8236, partial [Cyphellophora attinorum]